jgi:predicted nuclease of predicted toxin-antitoxin system
VKVLIDMNLSPAWVETLLEAGFEAEHWSTVGEPRASDRTILAWARSNGHVVLTHDLDFGSILAASDSSGPSVLQLRARDFSPTHLGRIVADALKEWRAPRTGRSRDPR